MLAFFYPLFVVYPILGLIAGVAVGRRLWGPKGAVLLGMVLTLAPLVAAYLACLVGRYYELTQLTSSPAF